MSQGMESAIEGADSFVSVLRRRADRQPERLAAIYLTEAANEEIRLTYGDLDRRARSIAGLVQSVAAPGDRILLLYPTGPDFLAAFFGCLYAGVVAIPLFPPRPNRTMSRLERVIEDSGARLALTVTRTMSDLAGDWGDTELLSSIEYLPTDDVDDALATAWREPTLGRDDLAFLQYTSGSTSAPRGVMVSHGNLLYNCGYMREAFELSPDTIAVTWAPHFHDMGLIEGLLDPIFTGYPTVVMPPAQFVQKPMCWLQAISRFRGTHAGAPNFAYDLCVRKIKPEQRAELDLSSWSMAYSGAEPVRSETLDRFAEYFAPCGFRREALFPCYGLAEATLMVTGGWKAAPPIVKEVEAAALECDRIVPVRDSSGKRRSLVGCGHVRRQTKVAIVDPVTHQPCPPDTVGEIWIAGPTVARGYWQRPDETRDLFQAWLADAEEGPFLRTGDLGFLSDGELFITGRFKDLIIIRGGNFYPQDIEWAAEVAHPSLRKGFAAAFSVEADGEERLVVACEMERSARKAGREDLMSIADEIRRTVSQEFELDVYCVLLLKVGSIHKTSSGKIQRNACREDFLAGNLDVLWESRLTRAREHTDSRRPPRPLRAELAALKPRDRRRALEAHLRDELSQILGIVPREIPSRQALGALGLDSMGGTDLVGRLNDGFGLSLSSSVVWNYPTVADIASHLADRLGISLESSELSGEVTRRASAVELRYSGAGDGELVSALADGSVAEAP